MENDFEIQKQTENFNELSSTNKMLGMTRRGYNISPLQ